VQLPGAFDAQTPRDAAAASERGAAMATTRSDN
jgi:hypothetical protein